MRNIFTVINCIMGSGLSLFGIQPYAVRSKDEKL